MTAPAYIVRPAELPGLSPTARRTLTDWIARVRESDRRACGTPSRAALAPLPAGAERCTASVDVSGGWPAPAPLPAWATTLAPAETAAHLWAVCGRAPRSAVSEPPRTWIVRYTTPSGTAGEYRLASEEAAAAVLRQITGRAPRAAAPRAPRTRTAPAPAPAPAAAAAAPAAPALTVPHLPPPIVHAAGTDGETLRARLDRACAALYAARAAVRDAAPAPEDYAAFEDYAAARVAHYAAVDVVQAVFSALALAHDDVLAQITARAAARTAA